MKTLRKIGLLLSAITMLIAFNNCEDPKELFIHDTNLISQMVCKASHGGAEYIGSIHEYNKEGELMSGNFSQEDIEGGYGLILFAISESLREDIDLTDVYLAATVSYDEIISPSLTSKHDISGEEGIIITVTSGIGTTRQYRIRGYYE